MEKLLEFLLGHIRVEQLQLIKILLVFLAIVPTGFVFIYQHKPSMIYELDIFKLLVFASIITTPFLLIFYALMSLSSDLSADFSVISGALLTVIMFGAGALYQKIHTMSAVGHLLAMYKTSIFAFTTIMAGHILFSFLLAKKGRP